MLPPIPLPHRDRFQAIDNPGHATRLVATQQPDKALQLPTWQGGHCAPAKEAKHSLTNRPS